MYIRRELKVYVKQACFFNNCEKTQAPKKSRKFQLKTQRNGSYGSD